MLWAKLRCRITTYDRLLVYARLRRTPQPGRSPSETWRRVVQQVLLRDEERRQPPPNTGAEPSA